MTYLPPCYSYSRAELLSLRPRSFSSTADPFLKGLIDGLYSTGLNRRPACGDRSSRFRGCRAGRNIQRQIHVTSQMKCKQTVSRDLFARMLTASHGCNNDQHQLNNNLIYPPIQRHAMKLDRQSKIGTFNIHSTNKKIDDIVEIMESRGLHILALQETWHEDSESVPIKKLRSLGFNVLETARPTSMASILKKNSVHFVNHGGVAIVLTPGVIAAKVDVKLKVTTFELLCCRITSGGASFILVNIYRPGSQLPSDTFFKEFTSLLEWIVTFSLPVTITGDMNVHFELNDNINTKRMNDILDAFHLTQHVSTPTHDHDGYLDVIITDDEHAPESVHVDDIGLSDHFLVTWHANFSPPIPTYTTVTRRKWKSFDVDNFITRLQETELCNDAWPVTDPDHMAERYNVVITELLDELAPMTELRIRQRPRKPWFDQECRAAKRQARKLERKFKSNQNKDNQNAWRTSLKHSRRLARSKASSHWKNEIRIASGNSRRTWQHINSLLGEGRSRTKSSFSANQYHDVIDKKTSDIRAATASADDPVYVDNNAPTWSQFDQVSVDDVLSVIDSSPSKQCDSDPLPTWLLKNCAGTLGSYITTMMNASLESGRFPSSWKHAIVTPLLKKEGLDETLPTNYRPVANLSFLSKVMERIVHKQLTTHLVKNNLLPEFQSAYRKGHSTETAVLKVFSDIVDAIENGQYTLLALLDLSAAFDTVDHAILLQRLSLSFGLDSVAFEWFRSYLEDRTQSVLLDNISTTPRRVLCGVPQGSVLGPILFTLYTADLGRIINSFGLLHHCYADDTQIYAPCLLSDRAALKVKLLDCVGAIGCWMASNRLKLNPSKSEFMWCATSRRLHNIDDSEFSLPDGTVTMSTSVRDLGAYLDQAMTLQDHVRRLVSSCFYQLRRIRTIRRSLPTSTTIQLVNSFIISRIDYCNSILSSAPACQTDRIQAILNAAARLIYGRGRYDHVTDLIRDRLHWLPVQQRVRFKCALLVFKALHGVAPSYISRFCVQKPVVRRRYELRSSDPSQYDLMVPTAKTLFGQRSFTVAGPSTWNSLPDFIKSAESVAIFKSRLKTHFFRESYGLV